MPSLINEVIKYLEYYPKETLQIAPLLEQLSSSSGLDYSDRKTNPGHVTASGIVIEKDKIILVFHPFLQKWLQPGGHLEGKERPAEAALREFLEETGLSAKIDFWHQEHAIPFDIDIHAIPANPSKQEPAHWHYDFRYLLRLDNDASTCSFENNDVAWRDVATVEEPSLIKIIAKLKERKNDHKISLLE